jgi:hypothetical protein
MFSEGIPPEKIKRKKAIFGCELFEKTPPSYNASIRPSQL